MTTNTKTPESKPLMLSLVWIALAVPYVLFAVTGLVAPGYVSVFFTSWIGFFSLLICVAWHCLGSLILFKFTNKPISVRFALTYVFVLILFVTPMCVLPIVGPAVITIHQALKAVY